MGDIGLFAAHLSASQSNSTEPSRTIAEPSRTIAEPIDSAQTNPGEEAAIDEGAGAAGTVVGTSRPAALAVTLEL